MKVVNHEILLSNITSNVTCCGRLKNECKEY